jgi:hypothetical protein
MRLSAKAILIIFLAYIALIAILFIKFSPSEQPSEFGDLIPEDSLTFSLSKADSLLAEFNRAFDSGDYEKARDIAGTLNKQFPGSPQAEEADNRLASLDSQGVSKQPLTRTSKPRSSKPKPSKPVSKPSTATTQPQTQPQPKLSTEELTEKILENELKLQDALSKMRKERDARQGITWWYNKNVSHYVYKNSFEAYIGQSDAGEVWLRIRIYYNGEQRLNVNSYDVYADDQEYSISTLYGSMERGKGPGGEWEWYDMQATPKEVQLINQVMKAGRTAVRCIGETKVDERALTEGEKLRLRDVMDAYKALMVQKDLLTLNASPSQ